MQAAVWSVEHDTSLMIERSIPVLIIATVHAGW
jgi:hypothetical protein